LLFSDYFWLVFVFFFFLGEAVNTACHIINRVYLRPETNNNPYEIWQGKKPTIKHFRIVGSKCYILRDRENLGKFDPKSDEGIFLRYSTKCRAYRVFNKRTETIMESINVVVQLIHTELPTPSADMIKPSTSPRETPSISPTAESLPVPPNVTSEITASASENEEEPTNPPKQSWVKLNHPSQHLIGTIEEGRRLRNRVIQPTSEVANQVSYNCYLTQTEPKKVDDALQDESWISAMHGELHQLPLYIGFRKPNSRQIRSLAVECPNGR